MVTDENGNIAIKYYQTVPKEVTVGSVLYQFEIRANINMAWVRPEHVEAILAITKQCCGGTRHNVFRYANENDVRQWTNRGGR